MSKQRWVEVFTDGAQRHVCDSCARRRQADGRKLARQLTLRYAAETACCTDCREWGTYAG